MNAHNFLKLVKVMRVLPPLMCLTMCLHCGLLLCGLECVWCEVMLGLLVFFVLYVASVEVGFCKLHRAGLLYAYVVYLCCNFERGVGFGAMRHPAQWVMFLIGLALCVNFIVQRIRKEKCK